MNVSLQARPPLLARFSGWELAGAAFAVAVVVLLACYWRTAWSLASVWAHDGTYQYAFLIFPLSAWVAFEQRRRLFVNRPVPSVWGLVAVAMVCGVWFVGHALAINLARHFAFVAMFPALVLACWGWRALWTLKFPLAYLVVFAVPWGDALVGPLQDITARMAVGVLHVTGVPVLLNGREIITPTAVWMVADACSGVKFFIACTALGCLFGYLIFERSWKRVMFTVLSAVVPVVANGLRVYFTILIGETWGLEYATGTDHMIFGWQFFGTVLAVWLFVGWLCRDKVVRRERRGADASKPIITRVVIWPVAVLLLVAGPVWAVSTKSTVPAQALVLNAPALEGWEPPTMPATDWRPAFKGAAGQFHVSYSSIDGRAPVDLFHAVYTGKPRRGHSLITFGNDLYDAGRSRVLASGFHQVELADGLRVRVRELRLSGANGPRLIWYWYCVDGRCTASPVMIKVLQAWQALRGSMSRSSVWALSAPIEQGARQQTRHDLRKFARALPMAAMLDGGHRGVHALAGARP